jgi:ABC-type cobalamin transport system ATPase subunit
MMLTHLTVRNFKRFGEVEIELGNPVVLIGPNNSGKTTVLQALALWDIGLGRWVEKRSGKATPEKRAGVAVNRKDLFAVQIPAANQLWRDLHVRSAQRTDGRLQTSNVRIDILVEAVSNGKLWQCGLEFDYANEESFYCRPLRLSEDKNPERMQIPDEALQMRVAFLPPMSGLAANETKLDPGAINVRLGEGRTAEVLRNLCLQILTGEGGPQRWDAICTHITNLFGVTLDEPTYVKERGEITMTYREPSGVRLDLSASGRGMQQTLLLLAHLSANAGTVLLLDEPDAHLEILRQRQIYQLLTEVAREHGSQIVAASHSEVILNEAADRDVVVAFIGKPHRIDDRGSQLLKSLKELGFDQYYQAEQVGWVLYVEGSTDLAILRAFADTLEHRARELLERPFAHYIYNQPQRGRDHFFGLREAKRDLVGFLLCDRLERELQPTPELTERTWRRKEIENYICQPETLLAFATSSAEQAAAGPLFEASEAERRRRVMQECIEDFAPRVALRDRSDPWWFDSKASEFLDRVFAQFFKTLRLPNLLQKTDYHVLARHVPRQHIDPEIVEVLDAIQKVAGRANPVRADENS